MDIIEAAVKLSQVGSTVLLLLALLGAYRGWWVPGRTYQESALREDAWKEMYEREKTARDADRERSLEEVAERVVEKTLGRVRP